LLFWNETISNEIREGKKIIVSAHGSSLRALFKHLMQLSDEGKKINKCSSDEMFLLDLMM